MATPRALLAAASAAYSRSIAARPLRTKCATGAALGGGGDLCAQRHQAAAPPATAAPAAAPPWLDGRRLAACPIVCAQQKIG